jgi:tRNA(Phe) wybutosine-synthesizing methylase Tyw3
MDRLGELCRDGKESAEYLWQVPHDDEVRRKIVGFLAEIKVEAAKQNRREMGRIATELEAAAQASASPQQVEILQDGFERLTRLWAAAKSGLF